ncbi:MAG TPA: acyl transferase [Saprospirales bacterium]|nr:acyl transferase [Saprospirales bacterium]
MAQVSDENYEQLVIDIYQYQKKYNPVYAEYLINLGNRAVHQACDIPYLPISGFKHHKVITGEDLTEITYSSSGTTETGRSLHHIRDRQTYLNQTVKIYESHYGPIVDYVYLVLLPNYLEREGSSLIDMMQHFIKISAHAESDFYLYDYDKLYDSLKRCQANRKPTVLFGVSFALMDFAEKYALDFPDLIIMETGGMKGQRKELPKAEMHRRLQESFGVSSIYSEYGMTELSSQLYSIGFGAFDQNIFLSAKIMDITDPLSPSAIGKQGVVCLTDLANIDSCSFIMTEDTGYINSKNQLVLTGRLDMSEARGCNLLLTEVG